MLAIRVLSSNKDIGKLIGENGRDIAAIREQCAAVLHISELSKGVRERVLTVKGTVEQIAQVFEQVCPRLVQGPVDAAAAAAADDAAATPNGGKSHTLAEGELCLVLLLPNIMAGRVIGKSGEKVKSIKADSGANVNVANDPIEHTTERRVAITGVPAAVQSAVATIVDLLLENYQRIRETNMVYFTPGSSGAYGGNGHGGFVSPAMVYAASKLQQQAQAHQGNKNSRSAADGSGSNNGGKRQGGGAAAGAAVLPLAGHEQILTIQINVPANSIGAIMGHRGQNIRDIRRQSGAEINVAEAAVGEERSIIIKGNLHQNELALFLIQSTLAAAPAARSAGGESAAASASASSAANNGGRREGGGRNGGRNGGRKSDQ